MSEAAQLCLILCNPMDCSLPGSSVRGIFQATVLEWVAISFSKDIEYIVNKKKKAKLFLEWDFWLLVKCVFPTSNLNLIKVPQKFEGFIKNAKSLPRKWLCKLGRFLL